MFRLFLPTLIALALFAAPMLAVVQEATPLQACASGEYPAAGALRITDGAVAWTVCSLAEAYRTVLGVSADVVLIEEGDPTDRYTIAYSAADGSELWRRTTMMAPVAPGPLDGQGIVLVATEDLGAPALVGVDAVTGEEQWQVAWSDAPLAYTDAVAVVWDPVQAGASPRFRGIDRLTGEELWVSDVPLSDQSGVMVARSPAVVLGEVLVVPTGATISAIDIGTGAQLWEAPHLAHLAAADGVVVGIEDVNGPAPSVTALDIASGNRLWTAPGRPSYGGILAVGDGVIVVLDPDGTGLVAYELASGNERWRVAQAVHVEPQLISGTSLVGLWESEVAVMSTTNGATTWSATQPFGSPLMNSAGSNGDVVIVAINSLPWSD